MATITTLKDRMRARFPNLVNFLKGVPLRFKAPESVFADYYRRNKWRDPESVSGPGSSLGATQRLRTGLPAALRMLDVRTMLDIPCGDFHWMKEVDLGSISYMGGDIVDDLIAQNNAQFASPLRKFVVMNLLTDKLPRVDLIFCRDCLIHFSEKHIWHALKNARDSGSTYLATSTHTGQYNNADIVTGQWHAINLQAPPYSLPPPLMLIDDNDEIPEEGKCIGVWKLSELEHTGAGGV